jgi:hypothetical protein
MNSPNERDILRQTGVHPYAVCHQRPSRKVCARPRPNYSSCTTNECPLVIPTHWNSAHQRIKRPCVTILTVQEELDRFRTQECEGKDVFDVTVCEPLQTADLRQPRNSALHDEFEPGASAGDGLAIASLLTGD